MTITAQWTPEMPPKPLWYQTKGRMKLCLTDPEEASCSHTKEYPNSILFPLYCKGSKEFLKLISFCFRFVVRVLVMLPKRGTAYTTSVLHGAYMLHSISFRSCMVELAYDHGPKFSKS